VSLSNSTPYAHTVYDDRVAESDVVIIVLAPGKKYIMKRVFVFI
jgi:hypothetical protein